MKKLSWTYIAGVVGSSVVAINATAGPLHGVSPQQIPVLEGNALTRVRNTCLSPQSLLCRSNARSARLRCLRSGRSEPRCNIIYFRSISRCIAECTPGPSSLQSN